MASNQDQAAKLRRLNEIDRAIVRLQENSDFQLFFQSVVVGQEQDLSRTWHTISDDSELRRAQGGRDALLNVINTVNTAQSRLQQTAKPVAAVPPMIRPRAPRDPAEGLLDP